ncbi:putative membrane protein [Sorangium cellulosum So ce56]|uniref:Membrane protein n=1 Tax=Sorangium cellulosum (strain So ce56) TaxID=448385 RepID=A9GNN2_SORC5|nr:putative membrane protein [Sorangium cellulosum So ce56]
MRRRVPSGEVDDVVQTVLCDALASQGRPADPTELRRWLLGIARHKVADHHRRSAREAATELPDLPVGPPPVEARELARWAEEQASASRDARQTLSWMAREGEGEKLESIAADEQVPAARVRQRVSRMRRWMKERWMAELAAVAALAILAFVVARLLRSTSEAPVIAPLPEPQPSAPPDGPSPPIAPPSPLDALERARSLRAEALRACDEAAFRRCLDQLDEADRLDPAGRDAPEIAAARERALEALRAPTEKAPAPVNDKLDRKDESNSRPAPTPRPKVAPPPAQKPTSSVPAEQMLKEQMLKSRKAAPKSKIDEVDFPSGKL